jgi:hypothetical protein
MTTLTDYIAPDGGGKLEVDDKLPPFEGHNLPTTRNENPILFLVHMAQVCGDTRELEEAFELHIERTRIARGLFSRRPGDEDQFSQSHDNYVGIAAGSFMSRFNVAEEICIHGSRNGWIFNTSPKQPALQLQGGDVAFIKLCAGWRPAIWESVWLGIGLAISTTWNLADVRVRALKSMKNVPFVVSFGIMIYELRMKNPIQKVREYYKPGHPVREWYEKA